MITIDLGGNRGHLKFSWKELLAIWTLAGATVAHYWYTKIQLDDSQVQIREINIKLEQCEKRVNLLEQQMRLFGLVQ